MDCLGSAVDDDQKQIVDRLLKKCPLLAVVGPPRVGADKNELSI